MRGCCQGDVFWGCLVGGVCHEVDICGEKGVGVVWWVGDVAEGDFVGFVFLRGWVDVFIWGWGKRGFDGFKQELWGGLGVIWGSVVGVLAGNCSRILGGLWQRVGWGAMGKG